MTEILTAPLHLGTCAGCPAAINWGYQYVERDGGKYHVDCDPEREPRRCRWHDVTGCGVVTEIHAGKFYTDCDACAAKFNWWLWESSIPQLARALFGHLTDLERVKGRMKLYGT